MSNNQIGNNLLYLLSEKKRLKWGQFKKHAEYLCRQTTEEIGKCMVAGKNKIAFHSKRSTKTEDENFFKKQSNYFYTLVRKLSAMAYLDIEGKTGETVLKVAPPFLAELPFLRPAFLLAGARSPKLLEAVKETVKKYSGIDIEIKTQNFLPDTVIIKPEKKEILQTWLKDTSFQGNKLSDYIKISETPFAWNVLDFAGNLTAYKKSLEANWFSGNKMEIKEIFDITSLRFQHFDPDKDSLENDLSLVKIFHQKQFYKYYLFSKQKEERAEVQPDWGKFLIAKQFILTRFENSRFHRESKTGKLKYNQYKRSILEYNKETFELRSSLRLPLIFERGLTLLSGNPPFSGNPPSFPQKRESRKKTAKQEHGRYKKLFVFKSVPDKIAKIVAEKLEQNLY